MLKAEKCLNRLDSEVYPTSTSPPSPPRSEKSSSRPTAASSPASKPAVTRNSLRPTNSMKTSLRLQPSPTDESTSALLRRSTVSVRNEYSDLLIRSDSRHGLAQISRSKRLRCLSRFQRPPDRIQRNKH